MSEANFPEGIVVFSPREGTPDFVKADLIITVKKFVDWVKENPEVVSEYKGNKQVRLQINESQEGRLYAKVNNYVAAESDEFGI